MVRARGEESGGRGTFRRFAHVVASVVLLAAVLSGCVPSMSIRPPTAADIDRIKQGQAAVALVRLNASIDGKPVSPLDPGDNALRIYLARPDGMGAPERVSPTLLSPDAAIEGWHSLMLPPGMYYLLVLPPGVEQNPPAVAYHAGSARYGRLTQYVFSPGRGGFWSPELMAFILTGTPPADFQALQGFWFQVPEKGQVVYLGTLSIACRSGRGLFGSLIDSCGDFALASDPQSAKQAVARSLPGLGVDVRLLVPYGRPRPEAHLEELGTVKVVARDSAKIEAAFTGSELASWGVIPSTGRPRPVAVFNLLAIGYELATRAGADARAADRMAEIQPCIDRLAGPVAAIDYVSRFVPAFGQAARSRGIALDLVGKEARHRLTISVPIIGLRESGSSNDLALELALEVRIEAANGGDVRYYGVFHSAPELPIRSPLAPRSPLYALFAPERAMPHPVSAWCGIDGVALLEKEISAALARIALRVVRELRPNAVSAAGPND